MTIGILGGTGPEGRGLARRLARAGHRVVIGSRQSARGAAVAARLGPAGNVDGGTNRDAAARGEVVIVTVPYAGMRETLLAVAAELAGKTCVCTVAPIAVTDGRVELRAVDGSAAEEAARAVPEARWVAALHTVPASALLADDVPLDTDTLVSSDDDDARAAIIELVNGIPGVRGIDAGRLANARHLEAATALLIDLNRIHRAHTSLRILGL